MTKRERIEDLGVIYARLERLIIDFECDYPYFDSKHKFDEFSKLVRDNDGCYDFHCRLRAIVDELNELSVLAHGDSVN